MEKETIIQQKHQGFSLIEVLVAMGITLVVMAAAFGIYKSMVDSGSAAGKVYEIVADTQAALNLIRRDLQKTALLPDLGIPLAVPGALYWSGANCLNSDSGDSVACSGEEDNSYTITEDNTILLVGTSDAGRGLGGSGYVFDAVTPTRVNGKDAVIILYEDEAASNIPASLSAGGANFILNPDYESFNEAIRHGDFILLRDNKGNLPILQRVSCAGGKDCWKSIQLNQNSPINKDPRVENLVGNLNVNVSLLRRVTYYQEQAADTTWLVRQVNSRPAERLIPGIKEINLTYNIVELDADEKPFISETPREAAFFYETADGPRRVMDIRMVNVNITLNSQNSVAAGSGKTVKGAQMAKIAVRRGGGTNTPPPSTDPPPPPPDPRPGDYNCGYGSGCGFISCQLKCTSWSGSGCEIYFLPMPHRNYDPTSFLDYIKVQEATSWYNNGNVTLIDGSTLKGTFTLDSSGSKSFGKGFSSKYVDPVTNIFWMYYTYTDNSGKHIVEPVPVVWKPDSGSCSSSNPGAYASCDKYPDLIGCIGGDLGVRR